MFLSYCSIYLFFTSYPVLYIVRSCLVYVCDKKIFFSYPFELCIIHSYPLEIFSFTCVRDIHTRSVYMATGYKMQLKERIIEQSTYIMQIISLHTSSLRTPIHYIHKQSHHIARQNYKTLSLKVSSEIFTTQRKISLKL
jgi:hypothetical protein